MDIRVKITRNGAARVVTLDVEEYLRGVVPSEMKQSWHIEALKAQAVAARTYALTHLQPKKSYDVDDTVACQAYRQNYHYDATDAAIEATAGEVVRYNGKLAQTVYSASNGGETRSAKERWGTDYPYLPAQKDPWNAGIKRNGHSVGMSQNGARVAAERGITYQEILAFYYPGTQLEQYDDEPADAPVAYPCTLRVCTKSGRLNLRRTANANCDVIVGMDKGSVVAAHHEQDGWVFCAYLDNGKYRWGYASKKYLQ